jgi:hypothetical protein
LAGVASSEEEDEYLTHGSYNFHTRMGYEKVAHMKDIGKKFDRWYDLLWLQKKISKVNKGAVSKQMRQRHLLSLKKKKRAPKSSKSVLQCGYPH